MSETRLSILQHALGLDEYGQGRAYRSHYVTGCGSAEWTLLSEMADEGLLVNFGSSEIYGGDYCFAVTDRGRDFVRVNSPAMDHQQGRGAVMTDTAPVSQALIEFRSDRLGEFVLAMQGTGFQLRPLSSSSLPARPIKADYEITDAELS